MGIVGQKRFFIFNSIREHGPQSVRDLRSEPDFLKAACIVTSRRLVAETATRSRHFGKRRQAEPGSSAWSWPPCLCLASSAA